MKSISLLLTGAATLALSTPVHAQSATTANTPTTASTPTDDDIVVTAQKREERLIDVPISISVLSGADLDRSNAQGVTEALTSVPGVAVTEGGQTGGASISIRGVSAPQNIALGSSPIAYYLDSVPFGFVKSAIAPDVNAYDLERVEVLRGPQGTLYGASAQNGVVRILTKDPNLNATELKTRMALSYTEYGGWNSRADAALNVPLIPGKLAARAVVGYQNLSGWIDRPNDENANDGQLLNLRLKVGAELAPGLTVGASAWISRTDLGAPNVGDDNRKIRSTYPEDIASDFDSYAFKASYDADSFTVTSVTSNLTYRLRSKLDTALNSSSILTTNLDARVLVEEVNVSSTTKGPWQWSFGGIYRDAWDDVYQIRRTVAGALTGGYQAPASVRFLSRSYAFYGQLTRKFFDDQFEITGGLRYFKDRIGQQETSRNAVVNGEPITVINGVGVPARGLTRTSRTVDKLSPRAVITWHPSDRATVYASYSEGFRSGADQLPSVIAVNPAFSAVGPDNLKNYELGAKASVAGGLITFDSALYYMDWRNVQTPLLVAIAPGIFNAALVNGTSASGWGFDLGVTVKPIKGLAINFDYSMNGLKQDADVVAGTTVLFKKGERLNLSPKTTIGGSVSYQFPIGNKGLKGHIDFGANYVSARNQRILNATSLTVNNKSLLTSTARISLESSDGFRVSIFGDNLNNEQEPVLSVGATGFPDRSVRIRPRTVGLQVEKAF